MFVGHTQVGMIIQGLGGTSNYQMMIEIMVTLPPRSKACFFGGSTTTLTINLVLIVAGV